MRLFPIQDEGGLGKEGGDGDGLEHQFVVQHAVVVYFSVPVAHLLGTGAVGDNLETYLRSQADGNLHPGLGAHQAPQEPFFLGGGEGDVLVDAAQDFRGNPVEIFLMGNHHEAGHVGRAGKDGKAGTGCAPEGHDGAVFALAAVGVGVEAGLRFLGHQVHAVQQPVKQLGHGLGRLGTEHEDAPVEAFVVVQFRVPHGGDELDFLRHLTGFYAPQKPFCGSFQRHVAFGTGLEVGVLRHGGSAVGAVVEHQVVLQGGGQVQHVREAVPDGLRNMGVPRNHQVVGEDGGAVHQDVVLAPLAPFEGKGVLVLHIIFFAQGAAVVKDGNPSGIGL